MEVIKKSYEHIYSLWEFYEVHRVADQTLKNARGPPAKDCKNTDWINVSYALAGFLNSSVVACNSPTNMRLPKFNMTKVCSTIELLEVLVSKPSTLRDVRGNMLSLGIKTWGSQSRQMGSNHLYRFQNNMLTFLQEAIFDELHLLIGTDLMLHLLSNLSLFVIKAPYSYVQVCGCPLNEILVTSNTKIKETQPVGTKLETTAQNDEKKPYVDSSKLVDHNISHLVGRESARFFPEDHVMERTPCSTLGARLLIKEIFQEKKSKSIVKNFRNSLPDFVSFLKRHKSCQFKKLLNHYCTTDESEKTGGIRNFKVKSFCRALCKRAIPLKLWGSRENRTAFLSNLHKYISLRRKENMNVKNVMDGIKPTHCEFAKLPRKRGDGHVGQFEQIKTKGLVEKFFWWLMNSYFAPLLRNCFTITESVPGKNCLFFYRKADWCEQQEKTIEQMEKDHTIEPLLKEEVESLISSDKSLGHATLRFVPKAKGLRPVSNMSARINPNLSFPYKPRSINQMLTEIKSVIGYECEQRPELQGGGVSSLGEVFEKLASFKENLGSDRRPLYFVRLDFTKCYDRINQDKMLDIMEEVLKEDEYKIRKYCEIKTNANNNVVFKHLQPATEFEDNRIFPNFVEDELAKNVKRKDTVFVDKMNYKVVTREDLMQDLRKHIKKNIVQLSAQYFHQTCGIPQGSKISPTLCHLYLGHMERTKFPEILGNEDCLLIRWIDDPLLITPDIKLAKHYLQTLLRVDPAYNCEVNVNKCLITFDAETPAGEKVSKLEDFETWFPWCSLLINRNSLEIRHDYSAKTGAIDMKNSITFDQTKTPGKNMMDSLMNAMQLKLNKIFLDPRLNSCCTVEANLKEAFLYITQRFDAYVSELPSGFQASRNPEFFLKGLEDIAQKSHWLASRFMQHPSITQEKVFSFLYEALLDLIKRKSVRYGRMIDMVKGKMKKFL